MSSCHDPPSNPRQIFTHYDIDWEFGYLFISWLKVTFPPKMNISLVSGVTTRLLMESKSWNCDNQTLPVWTVAYWSPGWTHLLWNLSTIMWKGKRQGRPTIASKTIFLAIFGNVTNMAMHLLRWWPWGNIWILNMEKDLTSASNVTQHLFGQVI